MLRIVHLTQFILQINALIDTGEHQDISIETIEEQIEAGDLIRYLQLLFGSNIDLSHLQADPQAVAQFQERLQGILGGYKGGGHRKWGVEKSGLCLLIAWTNELIQQRALEEGEVSMSIKGDYFGALKELEDAIAAALDKLPSPQKEAYTTWVRTQLVKVRRDFALYATRLVAEAKKRPRRSR